MKPVIFGCKSTQLLEAEKDFFYQHQPLGFILFERNCGEPEQVKQLIGELKACLNHKDVPILIDQEGGRVVRLKPPHWQARTAVSNLKTINQAYDHAYSIAKELTELGITHNCAPCADLFFADADDIIGDRAFLGSPEKVAELAIASLKGFEDAGITPVIKHLPGHGRAPVDSHKQLPVVDTPKDELEKTDFYPFKLLSKSSNRAWGMTAHVVYKSIDEINPATQSQKIIHEVIRNFIGFDGFLISDCLSMKALNGNYESRAHKSIEAGCNAVLLCQGSLDEYKDVIKGLSD